MTFTVSVRPAERHDAASIAAIYNEGIRGRCSTFETRERTVEDILLWFNSPKYPILVAEQSGTVLGWIAASSYRARECYAGVAEFSVYVASQAQGHGVGKILMSAFIPACTEAGFWKLLSRIFPENKASRALCKQFGFREVGIYEKHAQLDSVWRDVVIVERLLSNLNNS
jgi:phosphinothricin acetyltransferase